MSTDTHTPPTNQRKTSKGKTAEERAAEVDALAAQLNDAVAALTTSQAWGGDAAVHLGLHGQVALGGADGLEGGLGRLALAPSTGETGHSYLSCIGLVTTLKAPERALRLIRTRGRWTGGLEPLDLS